MNKNNVHLYDYPILSKEINKGIWAHKYRTGVINIEGIKYIGYSMKEAIIKFKTYKFI